MQSTLSRNAPRHVGIIMDGNGRWATRQGLPRSAGHIAGGEAVRRAVEAAPDLGIGVLTLFAFASANWQRPAAEIAALMKLFHDYLLNETELCQRKGVRISLVGRRDRLPPSLRTAIAAAEQATRHLDVLHLRLAVDYSGRESIMHAAQRLAQQLHADPQEEASAQQFAQYLSDTGDSPEVDLVIRTGGERRLSDFLLWESAFAELYFTDRMWPDFGAEDLAAAVADFAGRERRFGAVEPAAFALR